jgi:hypothetical protein
MAGKLTMLMPWDSDAATLSGGSWATSLALLQDMQPTYSVQSVDATVTSTIIILQATSAQAWSGLALGRTNLSAAALIRIRAATSLGNLTSSPSYDSGWISAWPTSGRPTDAGLTWLDIFKLFSAGGSFVWWRIEIDDHTNIAGFVEFGRLYIAAAWTATYNFSYGSGRGHAELDVRNKTETGFTNTDKRGAQRLFDLRLNFVASADAEDFIYEVRRRTGTAGDFFVCLDPTETTRLHRKMMMATFDVMPNDTYLVNNVFQVPCRLLELR